MLSFDYSVFIITLNIKAITGVNAMTGKKIGYIRVSTFHQNEDRQLASVDLDREFVEKASAKKQASSHTQRNAGLHQGR